MDAHIAPSAQQDNLAALAERIRTELHAAKTAWHNALGHALNVGQALLDAQGLVQGNWKRWLRGHCSLSVSTAQLYQQLARHRDEIEAEISRAPTLSLRAARRLITKQKPEHKPKPAPKRKPATADKRVGAPPPRPAVDPAIVRLSGTLTKFLRLALVHQLDPAKALDGILTKLRARKLDESHLRISVDVLAHRRRRVATTGI
jgi:hypothetical protein